jgi:hypothetical protein
MCGSGTLRVTTRAENGEVVIEIGNTGPGIPRRWPRARSNPSLRQGRWPGHRPGS